MDDPATWSSPDLRLKGPGGWAAGVSLDGAALHGRPSIVLALDDVAAVALELFEEDGFTAFCRITARDGAEFLVTNAGYLERHRLAYRGFIAALVAHLGPRRTAILFTAGPSQSARRRRILTGLVGAAILILLLFVFLIQRPVSGGGWWIGVNCLGGGAAMTSLFALHQARSRPKPFRPDAIPEHCLPQL